MSLTPLVERLSHINPVLPVIIETKYGFTHGLFRELSEVLPTDGRVIRLLEDVGVSIGYYPVKMFRRWNYVATILPRDWVFNLADDPRVEKIYYDKPMNILQYPVVPSEGVYELEVKRVRVTFTSTYWTRRVIGADEANNLGYTGRGILVGVIDTGVGRYHPQVVGRVIFDTTIKLQRRDENGHGTWVGTCIAGRRVRDETLSRRLGVDVLCEGMAPEAEIYGVKALGYYIGMGSTSNIIEAVELSLDMGCKILNLSLGGESVEDKPEDDPYYNVFMDAVREGAIPCVAAGNSGPGENTIASPGCLPNVLTVGAYDPITGEIAEFSSRGPTNWGDTKPDIISPGVNIDSGIVGLLDVSGDKMENRFSPISGTSMATPHVAGLVTLMYQAHMDLTGRVLTLDELKAMMDSWARENGIVKDNTRGWGVLTWGVYKWWLSTQYGINL